MQAMQDTRLEITETNTSRIWATIGSSIGGLGLRKNHNSLAEGSPRKISPFSYYLLS